ncbi:interleukin-21 [Dromiciops gliroides]|uniref:interleukin-21 n=1 Tax=Dromiciops gliroides TaxID=33562 RepID=UPI001CC4D8CC|nr:interleukin-21 [Dromiciops gliroides]
MERTIICCLVIIFFGTLASNSNSSPTRRQSRLVQLLQIVEQLKTCVNDTDTALLLTPENVEKHCSQLFKCFQKDPITTLNNEERKGDLIFLIKQLRRKLPWKEAKNTNSTCPSCDSFEEKRPQEFLDSLRSLLQKMISSDQHHHRCHGHCT